MDYLRHVVYMAGAVLQRCALALLSSPGVCYATQVVKRNRHFFLVLAASLLVAALRAGKFGAAPVPADFGDHDGSGLEEKNLWDLYGYGEPLTAKRATVAAFFVAFIVDPRVALGLAHAWGGFDALFFGASEVALKSPFSLPMLALFPGSLAAQYVSFFADTNRALSAILIANLVLIDVRGWADFVAACAFTSSTVAAMVGRFVSRAVFSVALAACTFAFWRAVSLSIVWLDAALLLLALLASVGYAFRSTKYIVISLWRSPVRRERQLAVISAINSCDESGLFSGCRWDALYVKDDTDVREGGFGRVFLGASRSRSTDERVAIKEYKSRAQEQPGMDLAVRLAKAAIAHDMAITEHLLESIRTVAARLHDPRIEKDEARAVEIEVRSPWRPSQARRLIFAHPFLPPLTPFFPQPRNRSARCAP